MLRHNISKHWPTKSQRPWGLWLAKQTTSKLKNRNMKIIPDTVFLRFCILTKTRWLLTIVTPSWMSFLTSLNELTVSVVYLFQLDFCNDDSAWQAIPKSVAYHHQQPFFIHVCRSRLHVCGLALSLLATSVIGFRLWVRFESVTFISSYLGPAATWGFFSLVNIQMQEAEPSPAYIFKTSSHVTFTHMSLAKTSHGALVSTNGTMKRTSFTQVGDTSKVTLQRKYMFNSISS